MGGQSVEPPRKSFFDFLLLSFFSIFSVVRDVFLISFYILKFVIILLSGNNNDKYMIFLLKVYLNLNPRK
ncbi:hypothetical protein NV63_09610 [Elizabethkingia anophelis]|nr:hypothetical protein NV63_09610 [Elizabethkingia anophelis]